MSDPGSATLAALLLFDGRVGVVVVLPTDEEVEA